MRRRLSSRLTFFHKLVFPIIWLGGFASGIIASSISHQGALRDHPTAEYLRVRAGLR